MALRLLLGRLTLSQPSLTTSLLTRQPLLYTPVRTIIASDPSEVRLNNLRDNAGAVKRKERVGRGIGTGTGKTSKRGHKGQLARTGRGKPMPGSMGGAKPLYKSMRKFGFKNTRFARRLEGLNLDALQHHINNHTINPYKKITVKEVHDAHILGPRIREGVKLLARGADQLTTPNLHIEVNDCSAAARDAIEKLGGKVDLVYHNRLSLRYTVKPEKFYLKPKFARPPPKLHAKKYPNFPEPTPFTKPPLVLDDIEYPPDFNEKLKAEQKARKEKLKVTVKAEKKTVRREKKEKAIALAKEKGTKKQEQAKA
eukprot:Phypoly_transcript_13555.p1 GENE.Phypoly_transcript_13555~~Phypoly_transcript_13555.p1  ORF type:complete len:311 (+),score=75.45 Phypoly_transcript_13555:86-1018(+)